MAIAFDAFSNATVGTGDLTWTHTPVGTPKGVIVFVIQAGSYADEVLSVTYGSASMTEVTGSPLAHSTGEIGIVYAYFLGSGISAGAQTVTVDVNAGGSTKAAGCITVTGSVNTAIQDTDVSINSDSIANPSVTLSLGGQNGFCCIGLHSGINSPTGITPLTNWNKRYGYDFGIRTGCILTYDTIGTVDVTAGWTQLADDATAIMLAIRELYASVTLDPAALTATPIPLADVSATIVVPLDTAVVTATPVDLQVQASLAQTVILGEASLTATGIKPQINQTVVLETAALWFASSRNRQIDLETAHLTATVPPAHVVSNQIVTLSTATLTTTGVAIFPAVTGAPIVLDAAVLTATAIPLGVDAPVSRTMDTAVLAATGIDLQVNLTVPLDAGSLTATGIPLANVNAPVRVLLDTAVLTATGINSRTRVQTYIVLDRVSVYATGITAFVNTLTGARVLYTVRYQPIVMTVPKQGGLTDATALTVLPAKKKVKVGRYL